MDDALETAEFLARSENRVAVLFALRADHLTREALEAKTGASSITLGRILADFERRRWVDDDGEGYRLTPVGEVVAAALETFLEDLDVAATLAEFAHLLPTAEYDFDLGRLCNGTVVVADPSDPALTMRTAARGSPTPTASCCSHTVSPPSCSRTSPSA